MSVLSGQDRDAAPDFPSHPDPTIRRVRPNYHLQPARQSTAHRVNAVFAWAIVVFVALVPIPLGSNRPAFWTIWSTLIGTGALVYAGTLMWIGAPARFGLKSLWPEVTALLLLCLFVGAQTLPLARWLPADLTVIDALGLQLRSLSFDPGSSRLVLLQFLSFGLLMFLTAQVTINRRRARQLLLSIMIVIAIFAALGLASLTQLGDTLLGFEKQYYTGFATGTFVNRNSFASFLAVGLTIGIPMLMQMLVDRRLITLVRFLTQLVIVITCLVFIASALVATGSRMGLASAAAGVVVALVLSLLAQRGSSRVGAVATVCIILVGIAVVATFGTALIERVVLLPGVDEGRVEAHQVIWAAISERPWLGYGAGSFASVFSIFQRPPLTSEFIWDYTHSTYLALWFELGLVAGSIPLLIVAMLGWRALQAIRDPSSITTSIAALGTIVVFATHSLLDFPLEIEANAFLFTVILGLGAAGAIGTRPSAET